MFSQPINARLVLNFSNKIIETGEDKIFEETNNNLKMG
jgi:hypothetical protein